MAVLKLLFISLICVSIQAVPEIPPETTIFSDERLEGGPFEKEYSPAPATRTSPAPSDYRLPTTTRPIHYRVLWTIDINNLAFSGNVEIDLVATQTGVNQIVIHADDLNIGTVSLTRGATVVPQSYVLVKELQFMKVTLNSGNLEYNATSEVVYTLAISFSSTLRDDMYGIYKSWFRNSPSEPVRWMASTQFQATAARYAFPCYDEPSFKATFDIRIRRPTNFFSWSCTIQANNAVDVPSNANYKEDIYHTTPKMSTYLLALIVAEYDTEPVIEDGVLKYEVIARPAALKAGQGRYAFTVGQELLATMSNLTGLDFYKQHPHLKMTQASIPDFGAGAMENWGLLTYREAYLMHDPIHTSDYFKQLIAYILSHEIAHMWFGNWVTNEWWDVLWLNEGFARYYQYFLTDIVEKEMGFETRFIIEQVHTALLTDSSNNPQPLTNPGVGSPASVSAMFSTISYNKGAAIIRMTEHLLGNEANTKGLQDYIKERALDVALPIHLFEALQKAAVATGAIAQYGPEFSVVDYYKTWTEQPGHPVLYVQVDHQTGQMMVTQRRFNINSGYSPISTNWIIPITFATPNNRNFEDTKPTHIIRKGVTIIDRGSIGDEWVVFNKKQTGYYRVNYDDYTWNLIVIALRGPNRTQIHEFNRAQIVNDVFQFARSGLMNYTRAFNILSFLEHETDYAPWVAAMTGFTWLRNRFAETSLLTPLLSLIARWSARVMDDVTYYPIPNELFMRSYLRWQLAPIMCQMNMKSCREAANAQFKDLRDREIEVNKNSRNWVYCNGLREGSPQDFDYLFNRFKTHDVYNEKIQLLQVLGCTPHRESLNKFLDEIVNDNLSIRPQDYTTALNSATAGNEQNTQIVFDYMKTNLEKVTRAFGNARTPLSYVSSRLRTPEEVLEFQIWANATRSTLGDDYEAIYGNAESTLNGIVWATQVQGDINNYLVQGDDEITASTPPNVPITTPSTVSRPDLFEPTTPRLPSSAVTTALSFTILLMSSIAKFVF